MSVLWESDVYWRQNNKHFAELAPQNSRKQVIWRNYVTVTLCIVKFHISEGQREQCLYINCEKSVPRLCLQPFQPCRRSKKTFHIDANCLSETYARGIRKAFCRRAGGLRGTPGEEIKHSFQTGRASHFTPQVRVTEVRNFHPHPGRPSPASSRS